jgi:hypothetical protein
MNINSAIEHSNREQGKNKFGHKRPTYESQKDRDNQMEIATVVAQARGCQVQAMKAHSAVDFAAVQAVASPDGFQKSVASIRFWFEVKHRHIEYGQFATLILSLHKWMDGHSLAISTGKPFVFCVRFKNGDIYYYNVKTTPEQAGFIVAIGGRASRTMPDGTIEIDPNDIEPVVHIPMSELKLLYSPSTKETA